MDQVSALLPLVVYLVLFQLFVLQQSIADALPITGGMIAVVLGLMFFMEGIKQGLMPLGEMMGNTLPKKIALFWVLFIAFLLGVAVTFAEPAIGALKAAGAFVPYINADGTPADSIYLYALLNIYTSTLVLLVGVGVINLIKEDMVKPDAIIIDIGINRADNGKLVGDVDFANVSQKCSYITPVPGGVGPMTIAMLLKNTLKAAQMHAKKRV